MPRSAPGSAPPPAASVVLVLFFWLFFFVGFPLFLFFFFFPFSIFPPLLLLPLRTLPRLREARGRAREVGTEQGAGRRRGSGGRGAGRRGRGSPGPASDHVPGLSRELRHLLQRQQRLPGTPRALLRRRSPAGRAASAPSRPGGVGAADARSHLGGWDRARSSGRGSAPGRRGGPPPSPFPLPGGSPSGPAALRVVSLADNARGPALIPAVPESSQSLFCCPGPTLCSGRCGAARFRRGRSARRPLRSGGERDGGDGSGFLEAGPEGRDVP